MRYLLLSLSMTFAMSAQALTFIVNTASDLDTDNCVEAGPCSLRGALTAANLTPAEDLIEFNIATTDPGFQPATQHWSILVGNNALPVIEAPVVINGYSQPGASVNSNTPNDGGLNSILKIEILAGSAFGSQQNGLQVVGNNFSQPASTLRGLAISRFQSQIMLGGSSAHRVEGCYLGTNITGSAAALTSNGGRGVRVQGPGPYQIGGLLPAERNLMSGMLAAVAFFSASDGLRIQGNLIGTNAAGTQGIANTNEAISSASPLTNAMIGGSNADARNIISASHFSAISLFSASPSDFNGTVIEGNYLGTDVTGTKPLGNGLNPLSPSQSQPTIQLLGTICALAIGGTAPGQANLIAYSGSVGILIDRCQGLSTPLNRFYGNRGIPFDNVNGGGLLGSTPNDSNDVDDQGGNRIQNFPVISMPVGFLNGGGSSVALQYQVDTAITSATYPITVNFYRGACGGGSDSLLATDTITSGQAQQLLPFTLSAVDGNNVLPIVATAVDAAGNTSEFSPMLGDEIFNGDFEDTQGPPTPGVCP